MISAYGCLHIKMGLEPYDLLPENSYGKRAIRIAEKYFPGWMQIISHCFQIHRLWWSSAYLDAQFITHTVGPSTTLACP